MNDSDNQNPMKEVERKLVISPEDVTGAMEFWPMFEVPMDEELKQAFNDFIKNPTVENQDAVKLFLAKTFVERKHEVFQDELFTKISERCGQVYYEMKFKKDLEEALKDKNE
jgi:hypothetical protein